MKPRAYFPFVMLVFLAGPTIALADAMGPAVTYQGQIKSDGSPLSATADFEFSLWDSPDTDCTIPDGLQFGATQSVTGVNVTDGLFTVELNGAGEFGAAAFDGNARWLQIAIRSPAGSGTFATLCPRQALTAAPFALHARGLLVDGAGLHVQPNVLTGDPVTGFGDLGGISPDRYVVVGSSDLNLSPGITLANMDGVQGSRVWMVLDAAAKRMDLTHGWTTGGDLDYFFSRNKLAILQGGTDGERVMTIGGANNRVGIGTTTPAAKLDVKSDEAATSAFRGESAAASGTGVYGKAAAASGITYGVYGVSDSISGYGVYGEATSTAVNITYGVFGKTSSVVGHGVHGEGYFGVYGESSDSSGRGVQGSATATTGSAWGVFGSSSAPTGRGVFGYASAQGTSNYGVYGETASTLGRGVYGLASAPSGANYGGLFTSNSTSGRGVHGIATAISGTTYGVSGFSYSESGRGVYGLALDSSGNGTSYGVFGDTNNPLGYGVHGEGPTYGVHGDASGASGTNYGVYGSAAGSSGRGVYGTATSLTGTNYGVRGFTSSGSGYAVYASGDMGASGNKPFRVDHPLDPENKYLLHYSSEAPEPQNFYNGIVMLDASGETVIQLPDYFATINRDPRYLLTPIGGPMPRLHIAQEIDANSLRAGEKLTAGSAPPTCSFAISGGSPHGRVSWEVKAVRNDRWNQRLGNAPVIVAKDGSERGKYQHPELYGQPPEKGIDYQPEQARSPRSERD